MMNSIRGGVFKAPEGWTWQCPCGTSAAEPVDSRLAARDAYKLHRQSHKSPTTSPEAEASTVPQASPTPTTTPEAEKEASVPTTTQKKKATKKVAKKKAAPKKGAKSVFRIAFVRANKGEREVAREVDETGELRPRVAKRLGRKKVSQWTRVSAVDRDDAIRLVREGRGTEFTAKKGE